MPLTATPARTAADSEEGVMTPEKVRELERRHWEQKHRMHDRSDRELMARLLRGETP